MKVTRVATAAEFDDAVGAAVQGAAGPVFVVLFGSEQPDTGESWCEDCVIADPLIRQAIRGVPHATLIECPVGDRAVCVPRRRTSPGTGRWGAGPQR